MSETVPPLGRVADAATRRDAWIIALACVVFPILGLLLRGYHLVYQDNARWIPAILEAAQPGPLAGEAVLKTPEMCVGGLVPVLGFVARHAGVAWPFFVLHLLAACGTSAMLALIARRLGAGVAATVLAVAFLSRGVSVGKAATMTLEPMFIPRALALVPGLAGLFLVLAGRPRLAGLAIGVAMSINPLTGGYFGIVLLAVVLCDRERRRAWPALIGTAAATGGWVVVAWALQRPPSASTITNAEWVQMLRGVSAVFWPDAWDWMWVFPVVALAMLVAGAAIDLDARRCVGIAVGSLLPLGVGYVAVLTEWPPLLALQLPRALHVMMLVGLVGTTVLLSRLFTLGRAASALAAMVVLSAIGTWYGWQLVLLPIGLVVAATGLPSRRRVVLFGVAVGLVIAALVFADLVSLGLSHVSRIPYLAAAAIAGALLASRMRRPAVAFTLAVSCACAVVALDGPAAGDWPWREAEGPSVALHRWARETPEATRFALFPAEDGFRALAGRSVALEPQDAAPVLSGRAYAQAWGALFRRFGSQWPGASAIEALRLGEIDVIAVRRAAGAPELPYPIAWADENWTAYVRDDSSLLPARPLTTP